MSLYLLATHLFNFHATDPSKINFQNQNWNKKTQRNAIHILHATLIIHVTIGLGTMKTWMIQTHGLLSVVLVLQRF